MHLRSGVPQLTQISTFLEIALTPTPDPATVLPPSPLAPAGAVELNPGSHRMLSEDSPKVLCFVGDIYEDLELWYPKLRLEEAGYRTVLAGPEAGRVYAGKHGYPCESEMSIADVDAANFVGVLCPGGFMPDKLRRDAKVKSLIREFAGSGRLVAAICHGGWMPISAGVYNGVRVTGSPGIQDDLVNAGALFEDAAVVTDRHFVSSRRPDDLPVFATEMIQVLDNAARS